MKSTIQGKTYNTETATLIASDNNGLSCTDFAYSEEELFLTKKGAYFLYGRGGALSDYSTSCGNARHNGSAITPMTRQEALTWCEEHDCEDAISEYFADLVTEA